MVQSEHATVGRSIGINGGLMDAEERQDARQTAMCDEMGLSNSEWSRG